MLLDHGANVNAENDRGETPLHLVSQGKYDSQEHGVGIARLLLARGMDANAQDKSHSTPLLWAAFYGRLKITQMLLDHGANANMKNDHGETPLHQVSQGEYDSHEQGVGITRLLLARDVDADAQNKNHFTPFLLAALNGRLEIAQVLLDYGANMNAANYWGETPLHLVSRGKYNSEEHRVDIARLLLVHSMDANAQDKSHSTPLHWAAFCGRLEITQMLLDHGANANMKDDHGETPLHQVSQGEYDSHEQGVGIARLLLARGVDVNAQDKNHFTPFLLAALNGRLEIAQVLLDHGANANTENGSGEMPLALVSRGKYDSQEHALCDIQIFLVHGVDMNAQNKQYNTAIHLACYSGKIEITQMLLDPGAYMNKQNEQGETPLHLVSRGQYGSEEHGVGIARLLLARGADVNAQDKNHFTAFLLAALNGRLEIAQVLLDHGANANAQNDQGETPLHLVSRGEYDSEEHGVGIARLLLARGVDVNAQDKNHFTPFLLAALNGRFKILQVLLDHHNVANANTESDQCDAPLMRGSRGK